MRLIGCLLGLLICLTALHMCLTAPEGTAVPKTYPMTAEAVMDRAEVIVELCRQVRFITHAAGAVDGMAGSNSREAMEAACGAGCRFVELDFNFTADGELACVHDWYTQYSSAITDNVPLTAAEFRECRIYDTYTPMLLEDAAAFLLQYDDLYIVTDIKDDNLAGLAHIASRYPELRHRFIAQIYHEDEYDAVWEMGFENIIYTLYRLDWAGKTDTDHLRELAGEKLLFGYTFAADLCSLDGYVEEMLTCGVPLYIHTVNGDTEQDGYFAMGISGIYTDEQK